MSAAIDSIVVQETGGAYGLWRFQTLKQLGKREEDLENAIVAQPESLIMEPLELAQGQAAAYPQKHLRYGGATRRPDVVILTEHADVVLVEAKREGNDELRRGRWAIAQVVEYASLFSDTPEAELVSELTNGKHASWERVFAHEFQSIESPRRVASKIRQRLRDGDIHLVIACDAAPPDLADLVRSASNLNALGFALHVFRGKLAEREAFGEHECFTRLRERLNRDAGDWDFPDHYAQAETNLWHPLHIRRRLRDVLGDTDSLERRTAKWLTAAHEAVALLLAGDELAQYRRQEGPE